MERVVCVHGHFYQPLRADPWLESIEVQDSAQPFHDWNERISAECYRPNAAARILDPDGYIAEFVNNYARMSFDFGPTLLAWLQQHAPQVYRALLEADRQSQQRFSGHGSAIAQCYSHLIMPLASAADKLTQIRWALADFEHRFGRPSAGIWLPETAVDLQTLEFLTEADVRFVLLAPQQAARLRPRGAPHWHEIGPGGLDTSQPYAIPLPSGRELAAFFFHGPLSQAVAFDKALLHSGQRLAQRIQESFRPQADHAQLVSAVTDGETFGHHHRRGEMALAYALHWLEQQPGVRLTNFAEHLHRHPPTHEVQIHELTAWSCPHGVGRWRADCGCSNHRHAHWNQQWRAPLREALDWLHVSLTPAWFKAARRLLRDPWAARNDYIRVLLEPEAAAEFLQHHGAGELSPAQAVTVWKLLELQRHCLLMFTSCGWFHDDVTGIETIQNLKHAARAIQLACELFGDGFEPRFVELLQAAKSNIAEYQNAGWAYEHWVRPAVMDPPRLAAHYAARRLFAQEKAAERFYQYRFGNEQLFRWEHEEDLLLLGRAQCEALRTGESTPVWFGALQRGSLELHFAGARAGADFTALRRSLAGLFQRGSPQRLMAAMAEQFGLVCGPAALFRDEQRRLSHELLKPVLAEAELTQRQFYRRHAPLLQFLGGLGAPAPETVQLAANVALQGDWRRAFDGDCLSAEYLRQLLAETRSARVRIDPALFGQTLGRYLVQELQQLRTAAGGAAQLNRVQELLRLAASVPEADLSAAQDVYVELRQSLLPERQRAAQTDPAARDWVRCFLALAPLLRIRDSDPSSSLDLAVNS